LVQFSFTNIAASYALGNAVEHGANTTFDGLAVLPQRSPITPWVLAISLLSAAGIPPLSGFFGKFLLISSLPDLRVHGIEYIIALSCALFGIVVSVGYYFRAIRHVWLETPHAEPVTGPSLGEVTGMFACLAGTLVLGVLPQLFWTESSTPWAPAFTWVAAGVTAFGVVVWWTTQAPRAAAVSPTPAE